MKQDAFKLFLAEVQPELLDLEKTAPDAFEQLRFAFEELETKEKKPHLRLVSND